MKLKSKLTLLSSVTALLASPAAHAESIVSTCEMAELVDSIECIEIETPIHCEPGFGIEAPIELEEPSVIEWTEGTDEPVLVECWPDGFEGLGEAEGPIIFPEDVELTEPEVIVDEAEEASEDGEITDGGEITEDGEFTDGESIADEEEFVIPREWLKRGERENPELIYHTMGGIQPGQPLSSLNRASEAPASAAVSRTAQQDEPLTSPEVRAGSPHQVIQTGRKDPVALIQQGRVFLR
jgi:hypothetical protein